MEGSCSQQFDLDQTVIKYLGDGVMDKQLVKKLNELYNLCDLTEQINMLNDLYQTDLISKKEYDTIRMYCMKQHHERLGVA